MTGPLPPTQHELYQQQVQAARLARLADPDIEKRAKARMTPPPGRWSKLAERAAESAKSVAEQRRTEQAAAAADKAEVAWVLSSAANRQQRDRERAEAAATEAKALLKEIHALQDAAKGRKLTESETAERLIKLRRDRARLIALADSLAASVAATKAMTDDPHAYLASMLRRYPSLNTGQPIGQDIDATPVPAPGAVVAPNVDRVRSLLESVREAFVEAEDEYLAIADRQRRLAELAATEGDDLAKKYPALDGRVR